MLSRVALGFTRQMRGWRRGSPDARSRPVGVVGTIGPAREFWLVVGLAGQGGDLAQQTLRHLLQKIAIHLALVVGRKVDRLADGQSGFGRF